MIEINRSSLDHIEPIASAWLEFGASSFSLSSKGQLLKRWPEDVKIEESDEGISAIVRLKSQVFGELKVTGDRYCLDPMQYRLEADARMVASLLNLETNRRLLCEDLIDTRDQMLILSSISDATRKVVDTGELLKVLAANAHKLVKADEVCVFLKNERQAPIFQFHPIQSIKTDHLLKIIQREVRSDQPVLLSENKSESGGDQVFNFLFVPVQSYEIHQAVIAFYNCGREFSSYEIKLAKAIADYAGAQIEKNDLIHANIEVARIETEIELAQKIQQSLLLGNLPMVPGLDLCLAFQPASRISGDYYDLIMSGKDVANFIIGDISGKGMPAALFMAMTLKVIRSVAVMPSIPTPDIIINRSNEILYKDYNDAVMFSTLFVGQYNTKTRDVVYSNAGHSPIIYYRKADKKAGMLRADTVPLGLFPDMKGQTATVKLLPGDILVLATDGINETSNKSSRLFGFTQLMNLVEMLAQKSAPEIKDGILEAVKVYGAGKDQEDDRAMIVIKGV